MVAEWMAEALEEYDVEAWSHPPVDQATASDAIMAGAPLRHRCAAPRRLCRGFAGVRGLHGGGAPLLHRCTAPRKLCRAFAVR